MAFIFFTLFMTNNVRIILVLWFILCVCQAWIHIDSIVCGQGKKSLKVMSWFVKMGLHIFLKVVTCGIIVWEFWVSEGTES